jgi:hypothetical protein
MALAVEMTDDPEARVVAATVHALSPGPLRPEQPASP